MVLDIIVCLVMLFVVGTYFWLFVAPPNLGPPHWLKCNWSLWSVVSEGKVVAPREDNSGLATKGYYIIESRFCQTCHKKQLRTVQTGLPV